MPEGIEVECALAARVLDMHVEAGRLDAADGELLRRVLQRAERRPGGEYSAKVLERMAHAFSVLQEGAEYLADRARESDEPVTPQPRRP